MAKQRKEKSSNFAVWAAFFANLGIAAAKFVAAAVSGSASMLAEAIHSTVDSTDELFLLYGEHRSKKPPDKAHPFGHGHELYFWTLIVAINVFGIGGGISALEGVVKIIEGEKLENPLWAYVVLGFAFVFEGISWTIGVRQMRRKARGRSPWRQMRETKQPKVLAVVLEDSAALAGIVVAFCGVFFSHLFQKAWIDGAASIVIGGLLATVALLLGRETKGLLMGESADRELNEEVRRIVEADEGVNQLMRALTLQLGPGEVLLNMDVRFSPGLDAEGIAKAIWRLERKLRDRCPDIREVFIESQGLHEDLPTARSSREVEEDRGEAPPPPA